MVDNGPTRELVARWRDAERVVALTGAGLSTASGIPDFRSPGGRWETYQPVPIQDFVGSETSRRKYWQYKGETWQVIRAAEPNPGHRALADLANGGRLDLLVTQNVDGLHQRSGFPRDRIVDIHGTDSEVVCLECGDRKPREVAQRVWESGTAVPLCEICSGVLKPATISFGQSLVEEDLERAVQAAGSCDLFVAAGTSLVVSPINAMFEIAARAGAVTAILTASETPYDGVCQIRSNDPVEEVLPAVAAAIRGRGGHL